LGWLGDLMKVEEFVIGDVFYGICIPGVGKIEVCGILEVSVVSVWAPKLVWNRLCRGHRMIEVLVRPVNFLLCIHFCTTLPSKVLISQNCGNTIGFDKIPMNLQKPMPLKSKTAGRKSKVGISSSPLSQTPRDSK